MKSANHLQPCTTATHAYGPKGERVWKIAGGVTTYYYWGIGEKVSGSWTKFYVSGLGGKLVEYTSSSTQFFVTNHLGSVAARMSISGALSETYRFLPFGERYAGNATTHQFTGKERDNESGLDYFGARYLASNHGRWMSVDPELGDTSNPQRLNRYSYVGNTPTALVDPDGMGWQLVDCGTMDIGATIVGLPGGIAGRAPYCIYNWVAEPPPSSPPTPPPTKAEAGESNSFPYGPANQPLAPCMVRFLQPLFDTIDSLLPGWGYDIDLSTVRLHPYGIPTLVQKFGWLDPLAVTWGNDIYFERGAYNPRRNNKSTIALVAHELAHVVQFNRLGKETFAKLYAFFSMLGRIPHPLDGSKATYIWNPLEWEADAVQDFVGEYLDEQGENPCKVE